MDTITLYRVAHSANFKFGPWINIFLYTDRNKEACDILFACLETHVRNNRKHPIPYEDRMLGFDELIHCLAAPSMTMLKHWFHCDEIINCLCDADFTVYEITVPAEDVISGESGTQCAFDWTTVLEVKDIGILALLS